MHPRDLFRSFILASALATGVCVAAQPAGKWTVVELTADVPAGGTARGVNDRGEVVGQAFSYENGQLVSRAWLWDGGARTDIGSAAGTNTVPWGLNDKGTVVGYADGYGEQWSDGAATRLPFAGEATGINKSGAIIGHYWTGGTYGYGADRAILYRDGVLTELGTLGGVWSAARGINDKDVIVGTSYLPMSSSSRAFIWQDGTMRELPGLGGETSASGINNRGVIVGTAFDAAGNQWMVRWTSPDGAPETLMKRGAAYAVNDHGDIAGNNLDTGKPFLMARDGTVTWLLDLPAMKDAGWTSFGVMGMNDRGWIVGIAWKPGVSSFGTALLLVPR